MDIKVDINSIEVTNLLKKITRKQSSAIASALSRVSNMGILMITKRTQRGELPDGGQMLPYASATKSSRERKGRQTGFVDLTDTGKMFRSLDFKVRGTKGTLFFANKEREKIAFRLDTLGVGRKKTKRPFFAIGRKEEDRLRKEFSKFYFSRVGI